MLSKISNYSYTLPSWITKSLLFALVGLTILSAGIALATNSFWAYLIPFGFLLLIQTVFNFKVLFYLLFAMIPLSTEVNFENGFSTDLPTEPLIIYLMFVYLLFVLSQMRHISSSFFKHPLTLLIIFHLLWIAITTLTSQNIVVSIKFFLAKIWYVITFYFLAGLVIQRVKDVKLLFWATYLPLFVVVVIVVFRHAQFNFDFKDVNSIFSPFFRNHVSYACTLAILFPYIFFSLFWYKKWSNKWLFLVFSLLFIFIAIQLSYTRAAILSIFIAFGAYFIFVNKLIKPALVAAMILFGLFIAFMSYKNNYLEFAPNERTVTHINYEDLLTSTYKLEDISTMERVYRWVAGTQMVKHSPLIGFGPGNFYNYYKSFTVVNFKTYVSDNPERSGVHCYYLMTFIEQGLPGLLIFLSIIFFALIKGEQIYHKIKDRYQKNMIMTALLSLIIILFLLLINDLIETDKVGPFFFLILAIITNADIRLHKKDSESEENLESTHFVV